MSVRGFGPFTLLGCDLVFFTFWFITQISNGGGRDVGI